MLVAAAHLALCVDIRPGGHQRPRALHPAEADGEHERGAAVRVAGLQLQLLQLLPRARGPQLLGQLGRGVVPHQPVETQPVTFLHGHLHFGTW